MKNPESYAIVATEFLQSASIALSLGGTLYQPGDTINGKVLKEDPILRTVTHQGKRTIYQFHPHLKNGGKVSVLFESIRRLSTLGDDPDLPADSIVRRMVGVWRKRDTLHKLYQDTMRRGDSIHTPSGSIQLWNTKLVAVLEELGAKVEGATCANDRSVAFFVENSPVIGKYVEAWEAAWSRYTLEEDHLLYHLRGVLENREFLIRETKRCQEMAVYQDGPTVFCLPANASPEKIENMIHRLTH